MSNIPPTIQSNYTGCQCSTCKPLGSSTPGFIDTRPAHKPTPGAESCRVDLNDLLREFERGIAKTARASDRLRAQRKRHKKLREELQAKLDEAEAKCRKAMEIVMHVASGRAGTFAMIHFDHEIYLKARALVQYTVPRETAPHGQATK